MSLTNDEVLRIARLARIALAPEEAAPVVEQLNRVLAMVDEMRRVDTAGVPPMTHALDTGAGMQQPMRADEPAEAERRADYQAIAPAVEDGLYLVPKVIE